VIDYVNSRGGLTFWNYPETRSGIGKIGPIFVHTPREEEAAEVLGNFPTVFFVHKKTKQEVLEALKNGRMYACRGNYPQIAKLDELCVSSLDGERRGISGDELALKENPRVKISRSAPGPTKNSITVRLIRSGEVIEIFVRGLPMEIDFEDTYFNPGERIYSRIDLQGYGKLVSSPIFFTFGS
jgi:hypothetical protein